MELKRTRNCCCPLDSFVRGPWRPAVFGSAGLKRWESALSLCLNLFSSLGAILFLNRQYIIIMENKVKKRTISIDLLKAWLCSQADSGCSSDSATHMWTWRSLLFFYFYLRLVSSSLSSCSGETRLTTSNVSLVPYFSLRHVVKFCHPNPTTGLLRANGCSTKLCLPPSQVIPITWFTVDPIIPMAQGLKWEPPI